MITRRKSQPRNFVLGRCLVEAAELDRYWPQFVALWPAYNGHYRRSVRRAVFVLEPHCE